MIEVKANLAFRDRGVDWRAGQYRLVDEDDPIIVALIDAGYLTNMETVRESIDLEAPTTPLEPKKLPSKRRKKVTDVEDRIEPAGSDPDGTSQSDPVGAQGFPADAAGS